MADIVDINVFETIDNVVINATPNVIEVNIIRTTSTGAVSSVNGETGVVLLDANDIPETSTKVFVTPTEKTAITHANRTILDAITEAFTTTLKSSYDSAVSWISTNGSNLISHLTNYSNPHQTTAAQVGAYTTSETDTLLNGKVDKVTGKGLSTNDYTDSERKSLIANASTGVYTSLGLVKTSSTQFSIGAVTGVIVDSGLNYQVAYAGSTGNTTPFLTTADSTFVLIKSDNTILLQATFPTPEQRRENIYIGKIVHPDRTTILNVNNTVDFVYSPMSALRDLWSPLKLINDGVAVTPNGANLKINTSAGSLFGNGINFIANSLSPNNLSILATVQSTFMYRTRIGGTFLDTTDLDPSYYDVAGVRTLIPGANSRATNQRVYLFPTGQLRIQYGQVWYSSLTNAIAGIETESFIEYPNNKDNAILIGIISLVKNATNLTDITDARFSFVSKFGELSGGTGGLSTTTLQQAYDNSITPEILTNTTLGAVSLQRGSSSDTDNVLEVLNGSGTITAAIKGNGGITTIDKQNSLNVDGTGVKFPTVDAVNTALALKFDKSSWFNYKDFTPVTLTGTLTETQLLQVLIPANTLQANSVLHIPFCMLSRVIALSGVTVRLKITTSSTMPATTTNQVSVIAPGTSERFMKIKRTFIINGGNIKGFPFFTGGTSDDTTSTITISTRAIDVTVNNYLYVSATLGLVSDDITFQGIQLSNN